MARARGRFVVALLAGCAPGVAHDAGSPDVPQQHPPFDAGIVPVDAPSAGDGAPVDVQLPGCTTRVFYGAAWIRPPGRANPYDDATALVTWDGQCTDDGSGNSSATLSNGWQPFFAGRGGCAIDLEYAPACGSALAACTTRVTYGAAWLRPPGHTTQFDDAPGVVIWGGQCDRLGATQSSATLSNGWAPHFTGTDGCELSVRYQSCTKGLFANPVVATDCPDPGVIYDGTRFVMACTSSNVDDAFPIRTSNDLVHWDDAGFIFPHAARPAWAMGDFWAPEIHYVGEAYIAYFAAQASADGHLVIGVASSTTAAGPFADVGHPLLHDAALGVIDPNAYTAPDGTPYLLWRANAGAAGTTTQLRIQQLAHDGLSLTGTARTLIVPDQPWEGGAVQGPWMIDHAGVYYLFYSANTYNTVGAAVGVARATSPLGPFTKAPGPIVVSNDAWQGPGQGSIVAGAAGETLMVYHAWAAGHLGASTPGREVLVDRVSWVGGWPSLPQAPSSLSQPLP